VDLRGCVLVAGLAGAACFTDKGGSACPDGRCGGDTGGDTTAVDPATGAPGSTGPGSTGVTTGPVDPSTTSSTTSGTTAVDPSTGADDTGPASTGETGTGDDTSTGSTLQCDGAHHIMLEVAEASTALGNTDIVDGEAFIDLASAGTAAWKVALPCEGEWRLWVRGYVQLTARSYGFSATGDPKQFAFDVACEDPNKGGAAWDVLNLRPLSESTCKPQVDPLLSYGGPGDLELLFMHIDTPYLGRLVLTNDPDYAPQ
jgi:hypothetical protein